MKTPISLHFTAAAACALSAAGLALASPTPPGSSNNNGTTSHCQRTRVAILGAGVAGITAAQALSNASVTDFVVVERNGYVGGRVAHAEFGRAAASGGGGGAPYVVELGANWVQGLGTPGGPENPIWTLAKKAGLANTYSDYGSLRTYDAGGAADFGDRFARLDAAYGAAERAAGAALRANLQDSSMRAALAVAGWKPRQDMRAQAAEWWFWDWDAAQSPDESGWVFGVAAENASFYQWSDENNLVVDQRGFNAFVVGEAAEFLEEDDARLRLNTTVTEVVYGEDGVTVMLQDGGCVEAEHAIATFSVGVLQNDVVEFSPPLPRWKREAIEQFQMGTYTKIFFQFPETFWDPDTQYFLYADPQVRGYYPIWQSLSTPGFLPGSNIIFVTVVGPESYRVEQQSDEETKEEAMAVLRAMFPEKEIPEPIDFMYPRWSTEEWSFGSYSNWPVGMTLERHQNLRANVDRLWFAGEGTSAEYYGFLQGAWFEGRDVGMRVAGLLGGNSSDKLCNGNSTLGCGTQVNYPVLHGTSRLGEYNVSNGWSVSSFLDYGY
ncbi:amine oxidase [Xylariomycetidae sp. FL0641]|nr:amine oxidase [Xylariomycetidae sp. FL0641]